MVLTFFFCCAMTTVVNAQSSVEDLLKSAEQKAKLADKNPENGKMQYQAAMAFIADGLGEKKDFDRAQTYAYRAYQIAQDHPAPQDTLKGLSCNALSLIYMGKQSWDIAYDFMDLTMDAFEEELGKFNPATNGIKLTYGNLMLKARPVRAFFRIQEAFNNNETAPMSQHINNMMQAGVVQEMSIEMYIAEMSKRYHNCIPRIYVDCKPYYIVQTPDWNIERPLVGWMVSGLLRPESEKAAAYQASPIIVSDENYQFTVVPMEEKDKYGLDYYFTHQLANPHYLDFRDCSAGIIFFNPVNFDRIITKYREFKAANK
jgi:hypothetical protein